MGNPLPLVTQSQAGRRDFVRGAAASLLLPSFLAGCHEKKEDEGEENISANEDLMREHGILKRVCLPTMRSSAGSKPVTTYLRRR